MESDAQPTVPPPAPKSRITAALLTFFLGVWGVHKFYLGYTGVGIAFLLVNTVGWFFSWILLWTPHILIGIICFIEFIIYLTKSDEDFHQTYVVGRKPIF